MARKKAAQNADIKPWLSARRDCKEGRFIQVGNSLLLSKEFQALSPGANHMYACMALEAGGKNEFEFPRNAGAKFGIPETSFKRHKAELVEHRFIKCKQNNGNVQQANIYMFCSDWKPAPSGGVRQPSF